MDRNSLIGLSLIFLILVAFYFINKPGIEEANNLQRLRDSTEQVRLMDSIRSKGPAAVVVTGGDRTGITTTDTVAAIMDSVVSKAQYGLFQNSGKDQQEYVTLENDKMKVKLASKGGRVYSVELLGYKRYQGEPPLILFDGEYSRQEFVFTGSDGKTYNTGGMYFEPSGGNVILGNGDSAIFSMKLKVDEGRYLEQIYTIHKGTFLLDYKLNMVGLQQVIKPVNGGLELDWQIKTPRQEKTKDAEERTSTVYYKLAEKEADYLSETSDEEENLEEPIEWVSFKQQFFNATLVARNNFSKGHVTSKMVPADPALVKDLTSALIIPFTGKEKEEFSMYFYFGPNHYQTLAKLDIGLQKLIPLGWGIFGWVNRFAVIPIFNFLNQYVSSFGIIILILTLIIKFVLFPLVYKSYISTAKMRLMKPEIDEIKAKYGDDMQKIQVENMKLYKSGGVNPLGGCIPMLLQLPILIAMFSFFPASFELRQEPFLWADDLSTYDSIWTFGKIPVIEFIYGDHVSLFTLLMTISTLIYTRMNNQLTGVTGQMKWIGYLMPIIFLGVFNNYSAGLSYYYFLSNMVTFGQQFFITKMVDEKKLHQQILENKKKPESQKKSKFQQKLEEMAKARTGNGTVTKKNPGPAKKLGK